MLPPQEVKEEIGNLIKQKESKQENPKEDNLEENNSYLKDTQQSGHIFGT